MRRRDLLSWLAPALTATLRGSRAQQQRRVGFLSLASADAFTGLPDYRRGLDESGYVEGRNLTIEYRWADGDFVCLPGLAAELVRENALRPAWPIIGFPLGTRRRAFRALPASPQRGVRGY
jgi:putative ABC transport system substrate-binding protein